MTYTYAILDISPAAYREIRQKLVAAYYDHVFHCEPRDRDDPNGEVMDMHGIALRSAVPVPSRARAAR